jgi:cytochrome c oxidase cbb3-type subunit 3
MSSDCCRRPNQAASERRFTDHRRLAVACVLALLLAAACRRGEPRTVAEAAAPPRGYPVGPIPGTAKPPPVANPFADDASALMEGRRLFVQFNCAGCHGGHAGGGMGPSLRDPDWLYGSSDEAIYDSIAHGRAHGMPAWGTRLPSDMIWKLAAYVKSMRTPREPEPPR